MFVQWEGYVGIFLFFYMVVKPGGTYLMENFHSALFQGLSISAYCLAVSFSIFSLYLSRRNILCLGEQDFDLCINDLCIFCIVEYHLGVILFLLFLEKQCLILTQVPGLSSFLFFVTRACELFISSHGVSLKSHQILDHYLHKLCATIILTYLMSRTVMQIKRFVFWIDVCVSSQWYVDNFGTPKTLAVIDTSSTSL